jgi:hypothetical protein
MVDSTILERKNVVSTPQLLLQIPNVILAPFRLAIYILTLLFAVHLFPKH